MAHCHFRSRRDDRSLTGLRMQATSTSAIRSVQPALALLLLLILWQAMADLSGSSLFPSPRAVIEAALSEAHSGLFLQHLGITLLRIAASLVLALAIGGAVALARLQRRIALLLALAAVAILVSGYAWLGPIEAAVI